MDARSFLHRHLADRTLLVGAVAAMTGGLSLGSYLSAGEMFADRPAPQVVIATADGRTDVIHYMTDRSGRIPEYVIGTDRTWRPPELPLVRTAADYAPAPVVDDVEALPTSAPTGPTAETDRHDDHAAWLSPPPSESGDILAIGAAEPPVG